MFNRFFNLGFKSNTIKKSSRILSYSTHGNTSILDPNSPTLLARGSRNEFDQEKIYEEEDDDSEYQTKNNDSPHLRYAIVAAILALGSKMDEYGHCLFNFGVIFSLCSLT